MDRIGKDEAEKLDNEHQKLNQDIETAMMKMDIQKALDLYCKRTRNVCKYLKRPHIMYLTSRAAITDMLWILYGIKSHFVKGGKISGIYQ